MEYGKSDGMSLLRLGNEDYILSLSLSLSLSPLPPSLSPSLSLSPPPLALEEANCLVVRNPRERPIGQGTDLWPRSNLVSELGQGTHPN